MPGHRIHRIEIELETGDVATAAALSDRISRMRGIEAAMLGVFDELSGPDLVHRVERLEVSLGDVDGDALEHDLPTRLAAALRAALRGVLGGAATEGAGVASAIELVETFAEHGRLPWWATPSGADPVENALRELAVAAPAALLAAIRRRCGDEVALARLAAHADDATIDAVLVHVAGEDASMPACLAHLRRMAAGSLERAASPTSAPIAVRRAVLAAAAVAPEATSALRRVVSELVDRVPGFAAVRRDADTPMPAALRAVLGAVGGWAHVEERAFERPPIAARTSAGGTATPHARARLHDTAEPAGADVITTPGTLSARRTASGGAEESIDLEDAGLVLLWPFLPQFFTRVGVLDVARRFVDASARWQAITLLGRILEPTRPPPEFTLPLAKVLCGCLPDHAPELETSTTEAQHDECERLLGAVLERAPSLGALSVEGLRAAFLRRPGALGIRDGAWMLQVERRTHDAALARLGWSWDWIRLPWMAHPLGVQW